MRAGFGWEIGPFEQWDAIGVEASTAKMKEAGFKVAPWVDEMLAGGFKTFYKVENGVQKYYDVPSKGYKAIPGREAFIILDNYKEQKPVWKNAESCPSCAKRSIGSRSQAVWSPAM